MSKRITAIILCIVTVFSYLISPAMVKASVKYYGKVLASDNLSVNREPNVYHKIGEAEYNSTVELVSGSPVSTKGCSSGWYQIYFNGSTDAYVCGSYLSITSKTSNSSTASTDYERYLQNLGFPSSYWDYLSDLHAKHPNWTFEAIQTNLDWNSSVAKQSIVGVSLIQTKYDGWKSLDAGSYDPNSRTFKVLEGSDWYAANSGIVAYYMDPRNFLDEKHVFMFEKLSFDSSYQSVDAVKSVFNGGNFANYASNIYNAGQANNINPIYLASRIRQEVGSNVGDSKATSGASFTYDGKTYSGLYNVYNIGATTGSNPVLKGLVWANGGSTGETTSYGRAWRSLEASISGGAQFISSSYINKGQYTNYLQRFNVDPNSSYAALTHGYMTNIKAVFSESVSTYNSYANMNLLGTSFKFAIPVYKNMPANTELPSTTFNGQVPANNNNNNNNQSTNTADANSVINNARFKTDGSHISGISEGMSVDNLVSTLRNNGGSVSTSAYGNLATGDKIVINNQTYVVILYGDLNKDAKISLSDLVQLKKYILGYNNLNSSGKAAADVNRDGKVSLGDLVVMKKKILGLANIDQ